MSAPAEAATASAPLGGPAALLDREGGRVSSGKHVVQASEPTVSVRRDEPATVARNAAQPRADQAGLGDDPANG